MSHTSFSHQLKPFPKPESPATSRSKDGLGIRAKLIDAGVKNLREFGYPACDDKNILTDMIYKRFFASMLRDNLGKGYDAEIKSMLKECGEDA